MQYLAQLSTQCGLKICFDVTKILLNSMNSNEILSFLKKMVPDYISKNSQFEQFDEVKAQ
jgi:hypothetical protein